MSVQTTISPHNQQPLVSRTYPGESDLDAIINKAHAAQKSWSKFSVKDRVTIGRRFMVNKLLCFCDNPTSQYLV